MPRNANLCPITLVNKHKCKPETFASAIYIGRGSPLGNPYSHMKNTLASFKADTREEAIGAYEIWIKEKIRAHDKPVCDALNHIYAKAMQLPTSLGCFCHPLPCHGSVIIKLIEQAHTRTS